KEVSIPAQVPGLSMTSSRAAPRPSTIGPGTRGGAAPSFRAALAPFLGRRPLTRPWARSLGCPAGLWRAAGHATIRRGWLISERDTLPARQPGPATTPGSEGSGLGTEGRRTVRVIEDNAPAREGRAAVHRGHGCEVAVAADGQEGLRSLRAGPPPALILLDMLMPVLAGWHFLERLRRTGPAAGV